MEQILDHFLFRVLPNLMDCSIAVFYALNHFDLTLSVVVCLTFWTYLFFFANMNEGREKLRKNHYKCSDRLNERLQENLDNMETVKVCGTEEFEVQEYQRNVQAFYQTKKDWHQTGKLLDSSTDGFLGISLAVCALYIINLRSSSLNKLAGIYQKNKNL